jgi:hypothetical protein
MLVDNGTHLWIILTQYLDNPLLGVPQVEIGHRRHIDMDDLTISHGQSGRIGQDTLRADMHDVADIAVELLELESHRAVEVGLGGDVLAGCNCRVAAVEPGDDLFGEEAGRWGGQDHAVHVGLLPEGDVQGDRLVGQDWDCDWFR